MESRLSRSTPSAQRDQHSDRPHPFGYGRYQLVALYNSVVAGVSFLGHVFCVRLASRVMDHWCQPPDSFANRSAAEWKETSIPILDDGSYSQCTARDPPDAGPFARVVPYVSWTFDTNEYGDNIVSEWLLVCDRRWQLNASFGIYGVASVIWLPILGSAATRGFRQHHHSFFRSVCRAATRRARSSGRHDAHLPRAPLRGSGASLKDSHLLPGLVGHTREHRLPVFYHRATQARLEGRLCRGHAADGAANLHALHGSRIVRVAVGLLQN
ncbi:hypothetical protein HPB48_013735 [Haemaphysalis longicornis]|uniref:Uncharacterized protein n=1 Tax=Haemaphysalis longicornis TaxID=44386 RepID=A0A9J6G094_HAELO|nr:hypothetical protein HPB48_013735 [Haemaphysalis longicornis]